MTHKILLFKAKVKNKQTGLKMSSRSIHNNEVKNFSWESSAMECFEERRCSSVHSTLSSSLSSPYVHELLWNKRETNLTLFTHLNIFLIDLWCLVCGLILFLTHSKPTRWGDVRCFSDVNCIILLNPGQIILQKLFEGPLIIWSPIQLARNVPHGAQSVVWWSCRELMCRSN